MRTQRNAKSELAAVPARTVPTHMVKARVKSWGARRGSGSAITASGRTVRIPLHALRAANIPALSPGDLILIELDALDRGRIESLFVPD